MKSKSKIITEAMKRVRKCKESVFKQILASMTVYGLEFVSTLKRPGLLRPYFILLKSFHINHLS